VNLENLILEILDFPHPGMTFNELRDYLNRRLKEKGFPNISNTVLSRTLKRLKAKGWIAKGYMLFPNGKIAEIYTDPLNLKLGYILTEQDVKRVTFQKYRKAEGELRRLAENVP
jgi:DNA-binding Lrp family transcriptional regulator